MKYINNAPDAGALMVSARSFGNYDLAGALADLIDNSITAGARNIGITCTFNDGNPLVRVVDDGCGMSETELLAAMRPASKNPLEERSLDDLGRFGWGMKSASLSQCRKLTVTSLQDGRLAGAAWDLDDIENWKMAVLTEADVREHGFLQCSKQSGTEIIWEKCDRLSENGEITEENFNSLVHRTRDQIGLIFHKFLSGEVRGRKIVIELNEQEIPKFDPFYKDHAATQPLPTEPLQIKGKEITIHPFILPHFGKMTPQESKRLSGNEGMLKNQGFYVYRNHRLIISGTWFGLAKFGEFSQLIRIAVDIPNTLDEIWKITVDKSDAQLPSQLRQRLRQVIERLRGRSSKVYRSKGGKISAGTSISIWERFARAGAIKYRLNKNHVLIDKLLSSTTDDENRLVRSALKVIEHEFPVQAFSQDISNHTDEIHQTEADLDGFMELLDDSLPALMNSVSDKAAFIEMLRRTEPYASNWKPVENYLREKGWVNARA